ncbi:hypothetical protein HBH56_228490 [Parastagonospora nodorum]|uniref:Uncharacterized protein n=2 Tax=Phaeosphaeria nodorum (strain SN15 / ATCC MYA-4574 / FGSC 10173) TaxID=321614 RepID=Q0TWQ2_PHANO|nr:hypothetical protein SNOG_15980 [Parastagonospora nodorum SN15]KAH3904734.1 hypothetical protein HBH56_228490 [Parastagonospora nodorum]EAT76559.1 hypothetical protein SNOG_15980 [Parastagonospora nodorum SN15]KAH3921840.1 hypothetical protein HBH54_234270 [Parastagonospora nodorum]KAH4013844.1 hypothetical protein HBI09_211780 [Parastagonospora nodorum]KAH4125576.1 hypothetical protein HBH45_230510 [Parastagonospora nodorum]
MEDSLRRLGYTQRNKRSHAQIEEGEGSASSFYNTHTHDSTRDSGVHRESPFYVSSEQAHDSNDDNPFRFHYRRQTSQQRPERPASVGAAHSSTSGLHLPRVESMASSAPRRFAGDGFDFRRPAGAAARAHTRATVDLSAGNDDDGNMHSEHTSAGGVIDLTADDSGYGASQDGNSRRTQENDQETHAQLLRNNSGPRRLPRGMDIIIDLDNGDEEWRIDTPPPAEPGSPDIQFISSRAIDPPHPAHRSNSEGDEVEFVRENPLPQEERQRRRNDDVHRALNLIGDMNGRFVHLRAQVERFGAQVNRTAANFRQGPVVPPRGAPRARGHIHLGFAAPLLDFDMVAFDLGHEPARAPPAPQTYEPPAKAPEGFTRSPEEEGPLICPNCEEELCVGDDEVKRQVWIVKTCGHVYCGECTANRSAKKSNKGKERPPRTKPFKECVVEDCGKKVTNTKAMFQIFL